MIWATWRQHRIELLCALLVFLLIVPPLLAMYHSLASHYPPIELTACLALRNSDCYETWLGFGRYYQEFVYIVLYLNILPLLAGMFIGAPMVARELEQKTHLLAWTQSITRYRWLALKLGLLGGATILVFTLESVFMNWWSIRWDSVVRPWATYDLKGSVLIAYALFALALGTAVGTLVRKTVFAMAISMLGFVLPRLIVAWLLRPYFSPWQLYTWKPLQPDVLGVRGDWVYESGFLDSLGHRLQISDIANICTNVINPSGGFRLTHEALQCLQDHNIVNWALYHPVSQFWWFQGIETAIFLALTAILIALTFWWIKKFI